MRECNAPTPETVEQLAEYITSLVVRGYGTCVYAMSLAATAAFNYVAHTLGATGFQASCADLDILRRARRMKCPFILLRAEGMLYPQYDLREKLRDAMAKWNGWASKEASERLRGDTSHVHPDVLARWRDLAAVSSTEGE